MLITKDLTLSKAVSTMRLLFIFALLMSTSSLLPTKTLAATGKVHIIEITDFAFAKEKIIIKAGDTIKWINKDIVPHTVTEGTPDKVGKWDSKEMTQDKTWSYTFKKKGSFDYFCKYHPSMTAKVVVN